MKRKILSEGAACLCFSVWLCAGGLVGDVPGLILGGIIGTAAAALTKAGVEMRLGL